MNSFSTFGMVGLGRMGAGLVKRARHGGISAVGFDNSVANVDALAGAGFAGAQNLEDLARQLPAPRVVWIMVPAGDITETVVTELLTVLEPGDVIIDGGNSYYRDDIRRAGIAAEQGITYLDVGTSGGVWGFDRGFSLMIGGPAEVVSWLSPLWDALSPGVDAAPRTNPDSAAIASQEHGWLHCGPSGAGHFVKMVHNGIEYGLMAAYAEGLNVLKHANAGKQVRDSDAETAPLSNPQFYQYDFDIPAIAEVWRRGSVVGSWLLDLTASALAADPHLEDFKGQVSDSGEGRWTAIAAIEEGIPAPVLTAALQARFDSQGSSLFANKILSAMRRQFGGHSEKT